MKKMVIYSLSLLMVVIVLLLLAPFFLDVNDYKKQIEQQVEDATGRSLSIGGLKASLFPWIGITLDDVVLENRMGFSHHDFLKVNHLDIQVALLPLLSKKLEIVRFDLKAPEVFLEKNAKGESNWEDLFAPSSQDITAISSPAEQKSAHKVEDEKEAPLLAALQAKTLSLHDGLFVWQDAQSDVRMTLTDVNIALTDVQLDQPVHADIAARLNGDKFDVKAEFGPLGDVGNIDIAHLPVQLSFNSDAIRLQSFKTWISSFPEALGTLDKASVSLDVQLEQRPDGVRLLAGKGALLAAKNIALQWKIEMPDAHRLNVNQVNIAVNNKHIFTLQGHVKHLQKEPRYTLRVQGESMDKAWLSGLIPALNTMYAAHPSAWKTLKIGASLAGTAEYVDVRDMQVLMDDELVQLSGNIGFKNAPNIRLRMAAKTLHLDPWLPVVQEENTAEKKSLSMSAEQSSQQTASQHNMTPTSHEAIEPDLRFLKTWRISAQLQVEQLLLRGLALDHLRGTLKADRGIFKLDPLGFNLAGGQVRESARMNVNHYPVSWRESIHISGLKLAPVLKAVADSDVLDGTMQLQTQLRATGLLPKASLSSLHGTGQLLLQNGRIKGFDIAGALRSLSTLGLQKGAQYTDFAQLQATFNIRNGIAKNDDLFMASPLFRLTGKGSIDLPRSSLDYHVRPKLIGSLVGQGDTLTVRKGLSVPLHIHGAFASPSIEPEVDVKSLLGNIAGVAGSGGSAVGGVVGNVLQGVLGHQKKTTQPASKQQPKKPAAIEKQLQKSVQGLLGF